MADGFDEPEGSAEAQREEQARLNALRRYRVLDCAREAQFDDVVALAADILDAPVAVVNLIDADRQWFKAERGLGVDETALEVSICRCFLTQKGVTVVPDLRDDPRFADNPLVAGENGFRFYAGCLLETPDGLPLGTVCVLDTEPRPGGITERQRDALRALAGQTMAHLECRRRGLLEEEQRQRAERKSRQLALLAEIAMLSMSATDAKQLVDAVYARVAPELRLAMCLNYACGNGDLRIVADAGLTPEQRATVERIEFGQTICGMVAATRQPIHRTRIRGTNDPAAALLYVLDIDTYHSAPLIVGDKLLGTIAFGRREGEFSPSELELLTTLAANVAAGLNRLLAEQQLQALNQELEARVERALAAQAEVDSLYRAYFDNSSEGLFVIRVLPEDRFTVEAINPAHQAKVGMPIEELGGRPIDEQLPPDLAKLVVENYRRCVVMGTLQHYWETVTLNGRLYHFDTVLVPVRDAEGRIVRLVGSARDVTRQVEAEEALRQSQKLESMGQLTGGVAHDFNNLLTPIIGSLDLLTRRGGIDERTQRLVAGALQSAERAKTLVQRLLAFARRQPLQPVPVDLSVVVDGMRELLTSTLGPRVELAIEVEPGLPPVRADANQLEMALLNLAVNARDAMPAGGRLTLGAARNSVSAEHRSGLTPGDYVRLSIADTGEGMSAEVQKRAIEPFFSTKGIGRGTGLGLSMAHGLAAQLGGALTIVSEVGRGTTIEIWLPFAAAAASALPEAAPNIVRPVAGTALLIDDEELVRQSTADMLADLGFAVVECTGAGEALMHLSGGLAPSIIVTDHVMPGMTGAELAATLRARGSEVPVLLISGYAEADAIDPALPRLVKPFRLNELAQAVLGVAPVPIIA